MECKPCVTDLHIRYALCLQVAFSYNVFMKKEIFTLKEGQYHHFFFFLLGKVNSMTGFWCKYKFPFTFIDSAMTFFNTINLDKQLLLTGLTSQRVVKFLFSWCKYMCIYICTYWLKYFWINISGKLWHSVYNFAVFMVRICCCRNSFNPLDSRNYKVTLF